MRQESLALISTATACYVSLSLVSPASAATFLSFSSEPGDYIGAGASATFTRDDGYFRVSNNFDNGVSVSFSDFPFAGNNFWSLDLAPPGGTALAPGTYEAATRFPFQAPSEPGLSFSGNGRGCNTLTGRFNVQNIAYDSYGEPARFQADFEQHCEGAKPALFGQVAFDRNEFDADNLNRLLGLTNKIQNHKTALYYFSQPGDYIGLGLEQTLTPEAVDFAISRNFDNGVSFSITNFDRSKPGNSIWWYLNFAAPENAALIPGLYDRAIRYPFQPSNRPGLDFSGNGRGCNQLGGRFQVIQAKYGSKGVIEGFDALFEQHCEDELAIGPAVFGRIRYNASVTPSESPSESVPEPTMILGILAFGGWLIGQRKRTK
ncbi:MAG TPA: hypothetical protein DCP31_08920 [Cyanobacteria bacterium UBA8543]|nr:hypothetical protein [Cyanobacteria bacterium UBA8543]